MFSGFRALRALVVAASLCSPVFSVPTSSSALAPRSFSKTYYDNLIYLDGKKSYLYTAVSMGGDTYSMCLDNKWSGLATWGDKYSAGGSTHSITINEEFGEVSVQDGRTVIGIFDEEIELEYFHIPSWPSSYPKLGVSGVNSGYMGIDVNNPMSPVYSYWSYKWPSDYSKWYYDIMITYDWQNSNKDTKVDYAGIIVIGETVSWSNLLGISSSQAEQYGLPKLDGISSQPYIWLNDAGTFYIDNCFWVNGKQITWTSEVAKTPSGKVVADIELSKRWSTFPDSVVKAIYGWVSGYKYYDQGGYGYYQIPCDTKISFVFEIDGYKYTLTEDILVTPNPWGDQCIGSIFTPGQTAIAAPSWDVTFGFQFTSSFYYRAGVDHDKNQRYYKLLPLPCPSGGWDNNKYYSAPSYPYTSWKPTYTTTYGSGSGYGYNNGYSSSMKYDNNKPTYTSYQYTTSSPTYYKPSYMSSYEYHQTTSTWYQQPTYSASYDNKYSSSYDYKYSSSYDHKYSSDDNKYSSYDNKYTSSYDNEKYSTYDKYSSTYEKPKYTTTSSTYEYKPTTTSTTYEYKPTTSSWYNKDTSTYGWDNSKSTGYDNNKGYYTTTTSTWYSKPSSTYGWDNNGNGNGYGDKSYKPSTTYNGGNGYNGYSSSAGYNGYNGYSSEASYKGYNGYSSSAGYNGGYGYSSASYGNGKGYSSAPSYGGNSGYSSASNYGSTYNYDEKIAGNLAVENDDESGTNWKDKAKLYEVIIIVLGSVLGLGIIGAIVAFVIGRRKKEPLRPSAYRTIHETETSEGNAPLYGAEGGKSRFEDPYADKS